MSAHTIPSELRDANFPAEFTGINIPGVGITYGHGASLPSSEGWAKGARFLDTVTGAKYYNNGTLTTASWSETVSLTDTVWDDLRVPLSATRRGGSRYPGFGKLKDDGDSSQGVFCEWFDDGNEEELYFACQLPHGYKYGTDLHAHIHWTPAANGTAGENVTWGLEYTVSSIDSAFGDTATLTSSTRSGGDAASGPIASKHYLTELGAIDGSSISSVSAMLICRLYRDATSETDTYDDDAGVLEFDFHYQIDQPGSRTEYVK